MKKTYEKLVNLKDDNTYPIDSINLKSNYLQKILNTKYEFPFVKYELEYVEGVSLYEILFRSLEIPDLFVKEFNDSLNWLLKNCIMYFDDYILMINGDSHPGNIIVGPNNNFKMIDYYSDFLIITREEKRIYLGFINFLKKYEKKTFKLLSKLNLPANVISHLKEVSSTDEVSLLSDELVDYSRDQYIRNKLDESPHELDRLFEKVLRSIEYDISYDLNLLQGK